MPGVLEDEAGLVNAQRGAVARVEVLEEVAAGVALVGAQEGERGHREGDDTDVVGRVEGEPQPADGQALGSGADSEVHVDAVVELWEGAALVIAPPAGTGRAQGELREKHSKMVASSYDFFVRGAGLNSTDTSSTGMIRFLPSSSYSIS